MPPVRTLLIRFLAHEWSPTINLMTQIYRQLVVDVLNPSVEYQTLIPIKKTSKVSISTVEGLLMPSYLSRSTAIS